MDRKLLFALLLLPGLTHAVICKTVGPDGVVSFTNLPGSECPGGEAVETYVPPAATAERAEQLVTGVGGGQVKFDGYESFEIVSPEDGGTVRTNEGKVRVMFVLEPGLQQSHFITAYLDGMAASGSYGSSEITLTGVDPGTHTLQAKVSDSKGRTLIESKTVTFTLQRGDTPIKVLQVAPNPNSPGTYIIAGRFLGGPVAKPGAGGAEVTIQFPGSDKEYKGKVDEFLNWKVEVEDEPSTEKRFDVTVEVLELEFKKTQDINPTIARDRYTPPPSEGYAPAPAEGYAPASGANFGASGGGISTTPGQTNPAFTPKYTP